MSFATNMTHDYGEVKLGDKDFKRLKELIGERTGIVITEAKRDMIRGRLIKRLRKLNIPNFKEYCELLASGDQDELLAFTNAVTTNLTSFFREPHHFDFLRNKLLPELIKNKPDNRIRIWSAGCSSGEEPYSLAMTVRDVVPKNWDAKILATDLDSNMVDFASKGVYQLSGIKSDPKLLKKWFRRGRGENDDLIKASPELQEIITFKQLNLMHDWPVKGPFDFIFCRNVVIYFSKETQKILFDRYANLLSNQGHLFIGHSESLYKVCDRFKLLGNTIYQKTS